MDEEQRKLYDLIDMATQSWNLGVPMTKTGVGEYSQAEGSVNSVNSVGEPTHQAEFVLFVLFVFVSSQGYMCVSYIVLSDSNKFKLC